MFNSDSSATLAEFGSLGTVVQDCGFFGIGKIATGVPRRVVPVIRQSALKEALGRPDILGIICSRDIANEVPDHLGCLVADDPLAAAFHIHSALCARPRHYWDSFPSRIAPTARIEPGAQIAANDVIVGDRAIIGSNAVIGERSIIGDDCTIGPGTVIGTNAFELVRIDGANRLQPQAGGVRIGSGSIFLSGVMVARSTFAAFTEIGRNCAFDNLVHIAHDCVIGDGSQVTAGAIVAGRVTMGRDCFIGPNATISNGIAIGEEAFVTIGSTVIRDVEAGQRVTGYFATDHRSFIRRLKGES